MTALYDTLLRFYIIDMTAAGGSILYFHPGLNEFGNSVVWGGQTYTPFPIQIEGIEYDGQGRNSRPTLTVANIDGQLGTLVRAYKDLNGCKLTHRMTFGRFLDAENFLNGNDDANPAIEFPKEIYIFERKAEETREYIKFELASALDLQGQMLPKRNYNASYCNHEYGGELCGWNAATAGVYYDATDTVTTIVNNDKCGRRISSCECRWGATSELPYGGFPGVALITRG